MTPGQKARQKKPPLAWSCWGILLAFFLAMLGTPSKLWATEGTLATRDLEAEKKALEEMEALRQASSGQVRKFHEVLDELLTEFGYDVKQGHIKSLKNVAIRKVEVSDALPDTYRDYMKLLITERMQENSDIKIVHCVPCTSKTSRLIEGKIVITSPSTNFGELTLAAQKLGIETFMDVMLVYHATHMVLAFQIFKASDSEMLWTKSYNSETIKTRYQKLAIDYQQIAKAKPGESYQPEYRLFLGLGAGGIPNVGGHANDSTILTLQLRSTEKFDNRHSEFGMLLSAFKTLNSVLNAYPIETGTGTDKAPEATPADPDLTNPPQPAPFQTAMGIWGIYAHNFLGSVESYNQIRQGIHLGLGGILSSGYVAGTSRLGWDMYFGRRFALSVSGIYIAPSNILLGQDTLATTGGIGADVVLAIQF